MTEPQTLNPWGWKPHPVEIDGVKYTGYVMHSSASPRSPEALCRWAIVKTGAFMVITALNGRVFGLDKTGLAVKAQQRVERVVSSMGHQPVDPEAKISAPAQDKPKPRGTRGNPKK